MVGDKLISLKIKTKNSEINISDKVLNQGASDQNIYTLGVQLGSLHHEDPEEFQKIVETELV